MKKNFRLLFVAFIALAMVSAFVIRFQSAAAQKIKGDGMNGINNPTTVTNTSDSGSGSLREAITYANSTLGTNTIDFAIPGAGPFTIQPTMPLPNITEAVLIDGYTQIGSAANTSCTGAATLQIIINGVNAGGGANGLTLASSGSTVRGLVINGFDGNGIEIAGASNFVTGNFIGTNVAGTAAVPNNTSGIALTSGATNTIGGAAVGLRNVVSGNLGSGISISGGSSGNTIQGNYIGTNAAGAADLGNGADGIDVFQSNGNTVGGNAATLGCAPGNVISGNDEDGVGIFGTSAAGNSVRGNLIGTDAAGAADLGNSSVGVNIFASGNGIGGATATTRNVISGNNGGGVVIGGGMNNSVQGNYIGTNLAGTAALRNPDGVRVDGGASGNQIGAGTVNSAFYANSGTNTLIRFDEAGTVNSIGAITGLQAGEEILGMDFRPLNGVLYGLGANTAANTGRLYTINKTTAAATPVGTGTFPLSGTQFGFDFNPTVDRIRLVTNTGQNLRINPNNAAVTTDGTIKDATTQADGAAYTNNFVGSPSTVLYDIDLVTDALYIQNNPNGGNTTLVGSLGISATSLSGFDIRASDNQAFAALITNSTSSLYRIDLTNGAATMPVDLGGRALRAMAIDISNAGQQNVISGNDVGVHIAEGSNNSVRGNLIGTGATGTSDLGNTEAGVYVHEPMSFGNTVGGTSAGEGNTIRFNGDGALIPTLFGEGGVVVFAGSTNNPITGNSISENTGLGIDLGTLGANGVTANDPADADSGDANNFQNFPNLLSASNSGGPTVVSGNLVSTPSRTFRVEFFSDTAADPSGNGEGRTFLGAQNVTTNAAGTATITFNSSTPVSAGNFVTATATDLTTNDTSEFSMNVTATGQAAPAGIEADTDPRQTGNGTVNGGDVIQIRRFTNGADTPATDPNEFQRADSFPFGSRGDGVLNSGDVVQTRRYSNGADPMQPAGGPTGTGGFTEEAANRIDAPDAPQARGLRIESATANAGGTVTVNVRVDAMGDESVFDFDINYNSAVLSNPTIGAGNAGALIRDCNTATAGFVGCVVEGFPNNNAASSNANIGEIGAGNNQILLTITFNVAAGAPNGTTPVQFAAGANAATDAPTVFNLPTSGGGVTISGGMGNARGLRIENASSSPGNQVTVNVRADAVGDESVYDFDINYDSSILSNPTVGAGDAGALIRDCQTGTAGLIGCTVEGFPSNNPSSSNANINEIGAGASQILIRVTFTVNAGAATGTTTPVRFAPGANAATDAPTVFNLQTTDGVVAISQPTAASVSVAGRVKRADGAGLRNAAVSLVDLGSGETVRATTDARGVYQFDDVAVGRSYVVAVEALGYAFDFSTRVLSVTEELNGVDFVAAPNKKRRR